jgi:hypothetical protein
LINPPVARRFDDEARHRCRRHTVPVDHQIVDVWIVDILSETRSNKAPPGVISLPDVGGSHASSTDNPVSICKILFMGKWSA